MMHSKNVPVLLSLVATLGALAACIGSEEEWSASALDEERPGPPPVERTFSGTVAIKGSNSGTAVKGTYTRNGVVMETSARQLRSAQQHAAHYDGPTRFNAVYSIVVRPDGTVDRARSSVTFTHSTYTHAGTLVQSGFATLPLPVTGVTLSGDNPPQLKRFTFAASAWYPNIPAGLTDRGITGSVSVETCTATYTAKYSDNSNGAVYTYTVTPVAAPIPECDCPHSQRPVPDGGGVCPPEPEPDPVPPDHELFEPPDPER